VLDCQIAYIFKYLVFAFELLVFLHTGEVLNFLNSETDIPTVRASSVCHANIKTVSEIIP